MVLNVHRNRQALSWCRISWLRASWGKGKLSALTSADDNVSSVPHWPSRASGRLPSSPTTSPHASRGKNCCAIRLLMPPEQTPSTGLRHPSFRGLYFISQRILYTHAWWWRDNSSAVMEWARLQALVYDILPSTTAVFSYAIGSRKLSANEQFFVGAQTVISLLQTTQIKQGVPFIAANKVYNSTNKTTMVWIETEFFFYPGWMCLTCLRACFGARLLLRSILVQLRGDKEYPFSGVTKSGRVWRKGPESDARSVQSSLCKTMSVHMQLCRIGPIRLVIVFALVVVIVQWLLVPLRGVCVSGGREGEVGGGAHLETLDKYSLLLPLLLLQR